MFRPIELTMTIKYDNKRGMEFTVNMRLRNDNSIIIQVDLVSTRSPALAKTKFLIPYGHHGFTGPFDFNSLEERICQLLNVMYKDSTVGEFKQEDMIGTIDILMMEEAPVIDIHVDEMYNVYTSASV
uniref:C1 n=1 Tax=Tomato leaf curl Patna betasatellite TaxID=575918 RepID=E3VQ46_9VIRU|nr:C1 [Tomato leaf curl Patna betasatellite]